MHNCREQISGSCKKLWDYICSDAFFLYSLYFQPLILFFIALYVIPYGNPARVSKGFDPDRIFLFYDIDQACGVDLGYEDYPYVYFVTPTIGYLYRTTCVSECPSIQNYQTQCIHQFYRIEFQLGCRPNSLVLNCSSNSSVFNPNY